VFAYACAIMPAREREREGSAQGNRTFLEQSLAFEATS